MRLLWLLPLLFSCTIDRRLVERTRKEMIKYTQAGRRVEAAPEGPAPLPAPWAKGQYATWAITQGDYTSLTQAQIEEADPDGVIVMMVTISPKIRSTARLTFSRQPHSVAEAREVLTQVIRRRGEERPLTYRFYKDMPFEIRDALEALWGTLVPEAIDGAPPETATTPTFTMHGCRPGHGIFIHSPLGLQLRALLHPAVPITGLVSGKATTGETVELVDYGWAGGAPAL